MTDAVAGLSSRTNRLGSAAAMWMRALLTASIASIVRDRSASRAARSVSPSIARLAPIGSEAIRLRSEEHTSELQSLMRNSYAVFCLKKKKNKQNEQNKKQKNAH